MQICTCCFLCVCVRSVCVRDLCVTGGRGGRMQEGESEKWGEEGGRLTSGRHNENLLRFWSEVLHLCVSLVSVCVCLAQSGPNQAFNTADHQYLISIHLQRLLLLSFFSLSLSQSHTLWLFQVIHPLWKSFSFTSTDPRSDVRVADLTQFKLTASL